MSSEEQLDAWLRNPSKIAFMAKILAKTKKIYPIYLDSVTLLRNALQKIMTTKPDPLGNALTTLFGKKSLNIAGLHNLLLSYNLVSIFGLNLEEDFNFLHWINNDLQTRESFQPGWSRPCAKNIRAVEYVAIMIHQASSKIKESSKKTETIQYLLAKCLKPPFSQEAYLLICQIKLHLESEEEVFFPLIDELFKIRAFYNLSTKRPQTFMPKSSKSSVASTNYFTLYHRPEGLKVKGEPHIEPSL